MSEHAERYTRLATRLASEGWQVAAHDHPGHGRSSGRRGVLETPDELVDGAAQAIAAFASDTGAPPLMFAHSLGAVVATELLARGDVPIAGLVLSAPAIVPRLSAMDRLKLSVLSTVAPSHALEMPYDASRLTSDPDEIAAAHADALIHHRKSASLVRWLVDAAGRALKRAPEIDVPTFVLIAGSDFLIDTDRTREFVARLTPALVDWVIYDDYRHELLNETPERRERVTDDIVRWLDAHA